MRALFLIVLASCTPEIVPGAYLCGPDGACPEGLACSHKDALCQLPTQLEPFACAPMKETEPDNVAAEAYGVTLDNCSAAVEIKNCMPEGDGADWLTFTVPSCVNGRDLEARLSFPISFAELGLELWDLDAGAPITTDTACKQAGGALGELRTCIDVPVTPGKNYGLMVHPTGEGTCDGTCNFNRYTLLLTVVTPD